MPLVRIRWVDSHHMNGWHPMVPVNLEVESVGYLAAEFSDRYVLATTVKNGCLLSAVHIPKLAVISVENLEPRRA